MSRLSALIRRLHERRMAARPPAPPRRFAVFDHVPKTGGTALNQALLRIFTAKHVAVDRHVDVAAGNLEFADRYPIISGHFGGDWRRRFQQDRGRLAFTVIRDPVERAISTYNFWRHRIASDASEFWSPKIQAAKTLPFAVFIRTSDMGLKRSLFNTHYTRLAGGEIPGTACDPENQARHSGKVDGLAAEFDVIGVTERLPDTLRCFLAAIGARRPPDIRNLLEQVERNASPRLEGAEISDADRAFLAERNQLDFALHAIAGARLDRLLQAQSEAAIGRPLSRS